MSPIINRDDLPATPEWTPDVRSAPDFTRPEVRAACQLCKQQLDGRGDQ